MSYRVGLRTFSRVSAKLKEIVWSASAYFDLVASVWFPEPQGYWDRATPTGVFYIGDGALGEPQGWGGSYFNRV